MREIEFRGMDLQGRWFYGNLAVIPKDTRDHKAGHCISNGAGMPFAYRVRPETVGQYTGVKLKSGNKIKKIYEGDIVKVIKLTFESSHQLPENLIVKYYGGMFQLFRGNASLMGLHLLYIEDGEVIGNIHENTEALAVMDS